MQLDLRLVKSILAAVEDTPPNARIPTLVIPDVAEDVLNEHVELMIERGLLAGRVHGAGMGSKRISAVSVERLTWEGHEFLTNARTTGVWDKTMAVVKEKGGTVSFEVAKALLTKFALQHVGLAP